MFAYICSCAQCGYSLPPIYYLCEVCWKSILHETSSVKVCEDFRWPIYCVWNWKLKGTLVHQLLRRRKSCRIYPAEKRLALLAIAALPQAEVDRVDIIFYPIKKAAKKDHTYSLAQAIACQMGLRAYGVEIPAVENYKSLGRKKRTEGRALGAQKYAAFKADHPLLVDDIVTSGATMEALWRALGRPQAVSGLCLAYKSFNPEDKV